MLTEGVLYSLVFYGSPASALRPTRPPAETSLSSLSSPTADFSLTQRLANRAGLTLDALRLGFKNALVLLGLRPLADFHIQPVRPSSCA